jgi:hypothetical protein
MLLLCALTRRDSKRDAQIKALLFKELDWTHLLRMAHTHGMMPLLYWHLSTICPVRPVRLTGKYGRRLSGYLL